jgi:hypothetical protein
MNGTIKLFLTRVLRHNCDRHRISAYHHWCCQFESRLGRGVQHYVIKFVSDLWQVVVFFKYPTHHSTGLVQVLFSLYFFLFNDNMSVILWRSVLLGGRGGDRRTRRKPQPVINHWQTLSHNVVHLALIEIRTDNISGDRH